MIVTTFKIEHCESEKKGTSHTYNDCIKTRYWQRNGHKTTKQNAVCKRKNVQQQMLNTCRNAWITDCRSICLDAVFCFVCVVHVVDTKTLHCVLVLCEYNLCKHKNYVVGFELSTWSGRKYECSDNIRIRRVVGISHWFVLV